MKSISLYRYTLEYTYHILSGDGFKEMHTYKQTNWISDENHEPGEGLKVVKKETKRIKIKTK